jgi:hypothetical protein
MHYLFLDETYRDAADGRTIVIAAWAVEQRRLTDRVRRLDELRRPGKAAILKRIDSTLDSLDGLALVAWAKLDTSLFRSGEVDGTDDIPAMARADNIWSQSVIFAVGDLIKRFLRTRQQIGTVDIYFDPRSLRAEHAAALQKTLRETLAPAGRRFAAQLGLNVFKDLRVGRIEPVKKPQNNGTWSKFQMGTWLSDRLCSKSDEIISTEGTVRIRVRDMSDLVRRTVQQWDGKSFYS